MTPPSLQEETDTVSICVQNVSILTSDQIKSHSDGSWTRSFKLTPLLSSARFLKQLSLTEETERDRRFKYVSI